MPNRDGTGPISRGRGRQPRGFGMGPGGDCLCPECNTKVKHQRGTPCYTRECPKCGCRLTRAQ